MPRAPSIIGQCESCCTCPSVAVEWDSRPASKTKVGWYYSASPNTRYLEFDLPYEFRRLTGLGRVYRRVYYDGPNTIDFAGTVTNNICFDCTYSDTACAGPFDGTCAPGTECSQGFSFSVSNPMDPLISVYGGTACAGYGPQNAILTSEYTTATLKTNTVADLPAWDDDWNDTAGSFANLSVDEMTYTIRQSRYRFRFSVPMVGQGCYRVSWIERFTPEGGGAPTDTAKCMIWDGVVPEDYDPEDSSTWPVMGDGTNPYFEIPVPTTDGTTTVVDVVGECTCEECP